MREETVRIMRIDDAIAKLKKLKKVEGNIPICIRKYGSLELMPVKFDDGIETMEDHISDIDEVVVEITGYDEITCESFGFKWI